MSTIIDTEEKQHKNHHQSVTVKVNGREVIFDERRVTGLEIKETAINQGVPIQTDFALFQVNAGGQLKQIGNQQSVTLHKGSEFRAVAPDDNS